MKEILKNKKIISGIIVCVLLVVIMTVVTAMNQSSPLKVKSKEVVIEYGQQLNLDPREYLNEDEEVTNKVEVSIKGNVGMEKEKDYLPVGEYTLVLGYDNEKVEIKVIVKDTTAPTFKNFKDTIETAKDVKPDYTKLYQADDLSQVKIMINDQNVKYDNVGEYKAIVLAIDASENETSKEITVKVNEEKKSHNIKDSNKNKTVNQPSKPSNSTDKKPASSSKPTAQEKPEDTDQSFVAKLKVAKKASKILIVSSNSSTSRKGNFSYYQKVSGKWVEQLSTSCILGKQGMGSGAEDSQKTPTGVYRFTHLMGIASNPGTIMNYHKIDANDYWCGETYYNQFIDEDVHNHNCSKKKDEHLISYTRPYKYLAAFNYNPGNIKGKGFAYFLHVSGGSGYTLGCIGINESSMKKIMRIIDSNTVMIVDLKNNIANY